MNSNCTFIDIPTGTVNYESCHPHYSTSALLVPMTWRLLSRFENRKT